MKKGQLEIIGFMVIILLLFFSLIFYFKFSTDSSTDLLAEAEENLEVSNLLNGIKMYSVCDGEQLGDAIQDCIEGGSTCGEDACSLVAREVPQIVSMNGWENDSYMFYIGEELYSPEACTGNTFVDDYLTKGETVKLVFCY
jgi:hypothetical protein